MTTPEKQAEELCKAFESGARTWHIENYTWSSTVMFYLAAIHLIEHKPFADEEVQRMVMCFLDDKLAAASEKLLHTAIKNLKEVVNAYPVD
jgi:hypothetical protein